MADVVTVQYHPNTGVCLTDLSRLISLHSHRKVKIGAFSAASNVTGVMTAADAVSALIHRAGGMVFFDYATAAPYVKVRLGICIPFKLPLVQTAVHESRCVLRDRLNVGLYVRCCRCLGIVFLSHPLS